MCAQWWRSLVLAAAPSHTFCSIPISQGHKVVVRLSGVTAVVGSLHEDAAFTDDKLREWSVRTVRRSKGRSANRSPTDEISASDERPSVQLLPLGVGREGAIACHGVI